MPRKPRESSGTGIYHVMLRGINRQDIFEDAEDYYTFIRMMAMVANQGNQRDRSRESFGTSDHGPVPVIVIALPKPNKKEAALAPAFSSLKKRSKTCPPDLNVPLI